MDVGARRLRGLARDAAVVPGNPSLRSGQAARAEDVDVLTHALDDEEPLPSPGSGQAVREHATRALARLAGRRRGATAAVPTSADGARRGNVPAAGS